MPAHAHSLEDETGYTKMRGSFVDAAPWFDGVALGSELITASNDRNFGSGTIGNWVAAGADTGTVTYDGVNPAGEKVAAITAVGDNTRLIAALSHASMTDWNANDYIYSEADIFIPAASTSTGTEVGLSNDTSSISIAKGVWVHRIALSQSAAGGENLWITYWGGLTAAEILYFDNITAKKVNASLNTNTEVLDGQFLEVTDSAGKHVTGYVKKDQYTQEAYGAELLTNGAFSAWTADDPDGWTMGNEDATNKITQNPAGSAQILSDGTGVSGYQAILTVGKLYCYRITVTTATSGTAKLYMGDGTTIVSLTTAQEYYGYFTATHANLYLGASDACDITVDNAGVMEVTAPAKSAVKIYKEETLSTPGWATVETGFDYNGDSNLLFHVFNKYLHKAKKIIGDYEIF